MIELFTSRWSNRELARLPVVPVGISRGTPRWPLPYSYRKAPILAPSRETFAIEDKGRFAAAYRRQLEEIGLRSIMDDLGRLSREAGGLPLVLLCFEPAGQFCHRHVLRDFLTKYGVEIRELAPGMLGTKPEAQPALFGREEDG